MRVIESEYAFRFARDLPPAAQPLDRERNRRRARRSDARIEIVDSRFHSWTTIGANLLIADNGSHGAWSKAR